MEKAKIQLRDLLPVVLILGVAGLAAIFTLQIVGDVQQDVGEDMCGGTLSRVNGSCSNSTGEFFFGGNFTGRVESAYNSSTDVGQGINKIAGKFPTIGLVIVAALLIGILLTAFGKKF